MKFMLTTEIRMVTKVSVNGRSGYPILKEINHKTLKKNYVSIVSSEFSPFPLLFIMDSS